MALRISTGIQNNMLGLQATIVGAVIGVGLDFVDGGGSEDSITDSGNGLVAAGFEVGDILFVQGATTPGNDSGHTGVAITSVVAGTITVATDTNAGVEAGIAGTVVACARGGSLKDRFKNGVLRIYSSSQPADPDDATAGTLLIEISVASGAFAHGSEANGLEFGAAADAAIDKDTDVWSGVGIATGTAGWFRLCANPTDTGGASTTLDRIDGTVGTSGADLNITNTTIAIGATYTIDQFQFTLPLQYGS
jgi:hypothetical protein